MLTLDQSTATATCDLPELVFNLRWAWQTGTVRLFERIAPDIWAQSNHNPVALLTEPQLDRTIRTLAGDPTLRAEVERQRNLLRQYLERPLQRAPRVGYFSAEFGVAECLPIYSGGLGVLAGDHLKAASDLGLPLVGVGLWYSQGYFRQLIGWDGRQWEEYPTLDPTTAPLEPVQNANGNALKFALDFPDRAVWIQVWKAQVGQVRLYLLDTNLPENDPLDRQITARLYGGDKDTRMRQEIVLGRGGVQALRLIGEEIDVYHMNEGHAGFLALERARLAMHEQGCSFSEACRQVRSSLVFTTHTSVPAGIDYFDPKAIELYFEQYCRELGVAVDDILALGRDNPRDGSSWFSMAVLALKLSSRSNGVSQLHQKVSTKLWSGLYADTKTILEPIRAITNGVHTTTWMAPEMAELMDRSLDPKWRTQPEHPQLWAPVDQISDAELFDARSRLRRRLIDEVRTRTNRSDLFNPDALTIGFARRFATYKRAALILRDLERLARILTNQDRPVQILYAGKAHPKDEGGKDLIQQLWHVMGDWRFANSILFLPDYDIQLARFMVQGCDVWLNTPLRPHEASGTSGMKAALNGALNASILDGWWDEAYRPEIGWAIGDRSADWADRQSHDEEDAAATYDVIENTIAPLFYQRDSNGRPSQWLGMVRESLKTVGPAFSAARMVGQYRELLYSVVESHS